MNLDLIAMVTMLIIMSLFLIGDLLILIIVWSGDQCKTNMVAYIIVASKKIIDYKDKNLENYMDTLNNEIITLDKKTILNFVDLRLFNNFGFRQKLDLKELNNYAKLIFKELLNYYHKEFDAKDIIKKSEYVFYNFSTRTAAEEIIKNKIN